MLSAADKARYARQVLLTEIGLAGQARLLQSALSRVKTQSFRAFLVFRLFRCFSYAADNCRLID